MILMPSRTIFSIWLTTAYHIFPWVRSLRQPRPPAAALATLELAVKQLRHFIIFGQVLSYPGCLGESVEWDFQVTATVALWWRQPTSCEVYLQGRQHQRRHREGPIPLRPELDELALVAVLQMQIVRPLGSNSALPSGVAAVWTVVVPREEAGV